MAQNNHNMTIEKWFLLIISGVVLYLFWLIMEPFAFVLVTAGITAVVLSPLEHGLNSFLKHKNISSAIISLGVVALVLVPIVLLLIVMAAQARDLLAQPFADQSWIDGIRNLLRPTLSFLPTATQDYLLTFDLTELYRSITNWTLKNVGTFFASTTELLLNTVLYFLALYYLLVYKEKLVKEVVDLWCAYLGSCNDYCGTSSVCWNRTRACASSSIFIFYRRTRSRTWTSDLVFHCRWSCR